MTRAFDPRDLIRVRNLQGAGCSLDLEGDVLSGTSALRHAVSGMVPLRDARVATLLTTDELAPGGLVQMRWRRDRRCADIIQVAPRLDLTSGAAHVWHRLIGDACHVLGKAQGERVFCYVPDEDQVALQVLRKLGFSPYAADTVFHLAGIGGPGRVPPGKAQPRSGTEARLEPLESRHVPAVSQLYLSGLPDAVRAHADPSGADWRLYPAGGWPRPATAPKCLVAGDGSLSAAWSWYAGPGGLWLHLIVSPDRDAGAAVEAALAGMPVDEVDGSREVHCAAFGFETRLHLALRQSGFKPQVGRFLLVKHTTARVIEPSWRPDGARERALEPGAAQPTTSTTTTRAKAVAPARHGATVTSRSGEPA